jgi:hypothetical protein
MLNLIASTLSEVVTSDFVTKCLPENSHNIYRAVKEHIKGQSDPIDETLNESIKVTLKTLKIVLNQKDSKFSAHDIKAFKTQFEDEFWAPFIENIDGSSADLSRLRNACADACDGLLTHVDRLTLNLAIDDLPHLLFDVPKSDGISKSVSKSLNLADEAKRELRRQLERANLDDRATDFLLFRDLLFTCLIAQFKKRVERSPTVHGIFEIYRQNKISVNLERLEINLEESQLALHNELKTLHTEMQTLGLQIAQSPQNTKLLSRIGVLAQTQGALQRDLNHFDDRLREMNAQLIGLSMELQIFHEGFNDFVSTHGVMIEEMHSDVKDINSKLDTMMEMIQTGAYSTMNTEESAQISEPSIVREEDHGRTEDDEKLKTLRDFINHQILMCLHVYTEKMERDFFIESALSDVESEESIKLLNEMLHEANVKREVDVLNMMKAHMKPVLMSGYFSPNEVENFIYSAEQNGLNREKLLTLIQDECMRASCVNGVEMADRFRKYLEISYPPHVPFTDISPFLEWAERNQLRSSDAKSILRAYCAPHPLF